MLILVVIFPIAMPVYMYKHFKKLESKECKTRIGDLIDELNTKNASCIFYYPFFTFRRCLFVISILFLSNFPLLQIVFFQVCNLVSLMYLCYFLPKANKKLNCIEIFNELTVWVASLTLPLYTNFIGNANLRYNLGWVFIGLFLMNLSSNGLYLVGQIVYETYV